MATAPFPPIPSIVTHSSSTSKPPQNLSLSPPFRAQFPNSRTQQQTTLRRDFLRGVALLPLLLDLKMPSSSVAKEIEVGSYLPPSPSDPSFVLFKASPKDTPALRAEPWIEVKFEDEKQGKIQVVASPLIRLTNKPNATIEDIGSPEKLIASLGPFVTGNTYDPDELLQSSLEKRGDQTYYKYELETPFALTGSHNLAKATAKGNTVVLFVASANDKQWPASEKILKAMLDSFQST
ncbi:psbP domain-containing protein 6, chloroplastic isoform X3 [Morus notabilis]|uniref:psbP domain-containing protein 6, chloroplastic isoform X3 n=1 Tax=Morus notabilis TaxID=981085 RepID=UPI000CED1061|nr:psbP domain-containing protein 6, chloroplastic isoform X3 [Morus notabilis]